MKIKTIKILLSHFINDCKEFSFHVAITRMVRDIPIGNWEKKNAVYERTVSNYLEKKYGYLITKNISVEQREPEENVIWVMWWQGEEKMPPLVRACYKHLKKVATERIVLITKENYQDWVSLPDYILEKHKKGFISTTHLSDIIRVCLLKQYGGLWMDATVYADSIPQIVKESAFYTLHAPGLFPNFVGKGAWSTFLFKSEKNNPLFESLESIYFSYWKEHDNVIDYLLFDYIIEVILRNCTNLAVRIDAIPENRWYYELNQRINDSYSREKMQDMLKKSPVQKLSYKKAFRLLDEEGRETYYGRLVTGHLTT